LAWRVDGTRAHGPLVAEVAVRLSVLAIQSADVERVCKAHKVVHTKARNRLRNKLVHTLLFTYVNLRLINKVKTELGDFLMQALENELGEPARGEHDDTDEEEEDVPDEDEGVAAASGGGGAAAGGALRRRAAAAIGTEPLRINESKSNTYHRPEEE